MKKQNQGNQRSWKAEVLIIVTGITIDYWLVLLLLILLLIFICWTLTYVVSNWRVLQSDNLTGINILATEMMTG